VSGFGKSVLLSGFWRHWHQRRTASAAAARKAVIVRAWPFFRPAGACRASRFSARLAPWAAFLRRCAAAGRKSRAAPTAQVSSFAGLGGLLLPSRHWRAGLSGCAAARLRTIQIIRSGCGAFSTLTSWPP